MATFVITGLKEIDRKLATLPASAREKGGIEREAKA